MSMYVDIMTIIEQCKKKNGYVTESITRVLLCVQAMQLEEQCSAIWNPAILECGALSQPLETRVVKTKFYY